MGLATACELAEQGHSVEVFEASEVANDRGGSGGVGRMFRITYPEREVVSRLLSVARQWDRLEVRLGETLRSPIGALDYGDDQIVGQLADALTSCDAPYELIDKSEAADRWPELTLTGKVLVQGDGALIHSELVLSALVSYLAQNGVPLREQTPVSSIALTEDGVELRVGAESREFSQVVVCAGSGTNGLCEGIIELPAVRTTQEFTLTFDCEAVGQALPIGSDHRRPPIPGESYFWLPSSPGRMKLGAFATGLAIDPTSPPDQVCPEDLAAVLDDCARRTFNAGAELGNAEMAPCTYDFSPDEWFFAAAGGDGRLIAIGGFSGHGFKFAPYVAAATAQAVSSRGAEMPSGLPWSPLSIAA